MERALLLLAPSDKTGSRTDLEPRDKSKRRTLVLRLVWASQTCKSFVYCKSAHGRDLAGLVLCAKNPEVLSQELQGRPCLLLFLSGFHLQTASRHFLPHLLPHTSFLLVSNISKARFLLASLGPVPSILAPPFLEGSESQDHLLCSCSVASVISDFLHPCGLSVTISPNSPIMQSSA